MGTKTLNLAECSGSDVACIRFREPGQERADAGIQRNGAGLSLAYAPPCASMVAAKWYCPLCRVNRLSPWSLGSRSAMRSLPSRV